MKNLMSLVVAYILGSIPVGYLLVKFVFARGEDIRNYGSGATGATNVSRLAGMKGAVVTYVLDLVKGALAVFVAGQLTNHDVMWMGTAGVVAILGHIFPVWIGFHGGKGVATGVGAYLLLSPYAMLSAMAVWGLVLYWKKMVSFASIVATASVPLWVLVWDGRLFPQPSQQVTSLMVTMGLGCAIVIAAHHENIRRLLNGEEDKLSQSVDHVQESRP